MKTFGLPLVCAMILAAAFSYSTNAGSINSAAYKNYHVTVENFSGKSVQVHFTRYGKADWISLDNKESGHISMEGGFVMVSVWTGKGHTDLKSMDPLTINSDVSIQITSFANIKSWPNESYGPGGISIK